MNILFNQMTSKVSEIRSLVSNALRERMLSRYPEATVNVEWTIVKIDSLEPRGIAVTLETKLVMMPRKEEPPN